MELTWLNLVAYILIPILTAGIGGWVGAFFGDKYRKDKESKEKEIVRDIAVKALSRIERLKENLIERCRLRRKGQL